MAPLQALLNATVHESVCCGKPQSWRWLRRRVSRRMTSNGKTSLLVRRGGSCQLRYVQKCTVEGSRAGCVPSSAREDTAQSTCAPTLGRPCRWVLCRLSLCVTEGAFGIASSEPRAEIVSWQRASVVPNKKRKAATSNAQQNQCFTIARLALT